MAKNNHNLAIRTAYGTIRVMGSITRNVKDGLLFFVTFIKQKNGRVAENSSPILEDFVPHSMEIEDPKERMYADIYIRNFNSKSLAVRDEAIGLIKKLPKPTAINVLKELLCGEENLLKVVQVLNALSVLNKNEEIKKSFFSDFLTHDNPHIRIIAIREFSKYRDEEGFSILSSAIKDTDCYIRRHSLNLLCGAYGKKSEKAVFSLLHDADNRVRKSAILICGAMKLQQTIPLLIMLLDDPEKDIQNAAADSLRKITKQQFGFTGPSSIKSKNEAIEEWKQWWHKNQAAFALQLRKEKYHDHC